MKIDADFSGGNILVDHVGDDLVQLRPDLRGNGIEWCYWCFRVRDAGGRRVRFRFAGSRALAARGPAVSHDGGLTWRWLGEADIANNAFDYTFAADADEVRFSFGMPYLPEHWERFVRDLTRTSLELHHETLVVTPAGAVPVLIVGAPDSPQRIVLTCRHHACEMMPNYAIEGLLAWLADDADPVACRLREMTAFFIVPFVDFDGVVAGDQGKGRLPRDHNRDYDGDSVHATVAAMRQRLPAWGAGRIKIAFDLHCPHIAGGTNEVIYLVGSDHPAIAQEQRRFSRLLEQHRRGPLPIFASDFLPFGADWNNAGNFTAGTTCSRWEEGNLEGLALAASIELPYANARGAEVNAESARCFGGDLGRAIAAFLSAAPH